MVGAEEEQSNAGQALVDDVLSELRAHGIADDIAVSIASNLTAQWQAERSHLFGLNRDIQQEGARQSPPIPEKAPLLWVTDRLPRENPAEFTRRTYGEWIGNGLSRADILHLDKPLYTALASWLSRKGNELDFDLPTKKEINDRWVDRVRDAAAGERKDELVPAHAIGRLAAAMNRRNVTVQRPGRKNKDEIPDR